MERKVWFFVSLTVYRQMTTSPTDLFSVLKREIGLKSTCLPFAVKAIEALSSLGNLTEHEALKAANKFMEDMQTLIQGGITAEDHDKIDMIKRGKLICLSARVEAFLRAAARKGYRITETVIGVPIEDAGTTYFKENFYGGEIVYTLEDRRYQCDRAITAERLIGGYFAKFICRLDIHDVKQNKRVVMTMCEMANDEILQVSAASEQGLYKSRWEKYKKDNGYDGNRKVITSEINSDGFWVKWTGPMVEKTVIRRALKRVREVLPELSDTIYAFDRDELETVPELPAEKPMLEIPMQIVNVNLHKLTAEQKADVEETLDLFKVNPKLAEDKAVEIKALLDSGEPLQNVINTHYASIINIKKSKKLYPLISSCFEESEAAQ